MCSEGTSGDPTKGGKEVLKGSCDEEGDEISARGGGAANELESGSGVVS